MHRETPTRRSLLQAGSQRAAENSNRYTVRIEFPVSCRKQRIEHHSNRYKKPGTFAHFPEINRNIILIESLVSHSKQRTGAQINRNISGTCSPAAAFSLSHFQFLIATLSRIEKQLNSKKIKEKTFSNSNKNRHFATRLFPRIYPINNFRHGTAFHPEHRRRAAVPISRAISGVSTPEGRGLVAVCLCDSGSGPSRTSNGVEGTLATKHSPLAACYSFCKSVFPKLG